MKFVSTAMFERLDERVACANRSRAIFTRKMIRPKTDFELVTVKRSYAARDCLLLKAK